MERHRIKTTYIDGMGWKLYLVEVKLDWNDAIVEANAQRKWVVDVLKATHIETTVKVL